MKSYKILVVGDIFDNHIIRFLRNLKWCNSHALVDVISFNNHYELCDEVEDLFNKIYWFDPQTTQIRFLKDFQRIVQLNVFLKTIAIENHYDIVNIHFPTFEYSFCIGALKRLADNIVLTPWGSDVYRAGKLRLNILKHLYSKADYICNPHTRFGKDVRKIFNLRQEQLVNLSMGSETIDYIIENKEKFSPEEARKYLSLEGDYFITCGYNAHIAQNHKAIIDGIIKIKTNFNGQLSLIFPMTYPKNTVYVDKIKNYVKEKGLKSYFFTDYLDLHTLFCIRQSTDMFIHVQDTDANAASVQEYLLLGKKVLNGSWLRYDNMEIDGVIPYTIVKNLDSISEAILESQNENPKITLKLFEYIKTSGWKNWITQWDSFFISICNQ